jgi:tetratricopeptide (TPR) repeat protein
MREPVIRVLGLSATVAYVALIAWLFAQQPQSMAEVTGGLSASVGAYRIDQPAFDDGLELFRKDQFEAAVSAFERADAAKRDARTQFYIAYAYYRRGWSRFYHDDAWFTKGLEAINRAIAVAPNGRIVVDDPNLQMHTGDEVKAELEAGLRRDVTDFNPFRLFGERK